MKSSPAFRDKLQRLMDEKGMTRADLARHVWGTYTDERGYEVAKNRQTISRYLLGTSVPSHKTLRLMADAFGVGISDLDPQSDPVNRPGSGVALEAVDKRNAHLTVDVVMPTDEAAQVLAIVGRYAK